MKIRLLGPVELLSADRPVNAGGPRQRCVLAALAADVGRPVTAETLIDRVWGEVPPGRVRQTLQVYVARLRKVVGCACADGEPAARLLRRGSGYALEMAPEDVDLHRFRRLVRGAGETSLDAGSRSTMLRQALDLWRDVPLADLSSGWAATARETWQRQRLEAVISWARCELDLGRSDVTVDELRAAVDIFPLDESPVGALMRALYASGRAAEALDCYAALRRRLVDSLGCEPGPEAQQMQRAILRGEPGPETQHTPHATLRGKPGPETQHTPHATLRGEPGPETQQMPHATLRGKPEFPTTAPATAPAPDWAVPAQLPADIPAFAGRRAELAALDRLLAGDNSARTAAVSGTAGVGKTALAIHWAHLVSARFPDGQLYVNLRGFDPAGRLMDPGEALRDLLVALGTPAERVPHSLDAQAALYRSLLAGKRILVVLDNARDAEQVRPLLPGTSAAVTVVTSRDQLTPLVANDGAEPVPVPTLSTVEARDLLTGRLGGLRIGAEPQAVEQIIAACARLPLALAIVAARAQQTGFPLSAIAADLRGAGRLDALNAGDPASQVRAVFSWSYTALSAPAARLYRLVGLHPGGDISAYAAAAFAEQPLSQAQPLLAELTRASLLTEHAPGRYLLHDLLRAYAAERAQHEEPEAERHAGISRLFDFYLCTSGAAMDLLYPAERHRRPRIPPVSATIPILADLDGARAWLDAERGNLVATAVHACAHGRDRYVTRLAATLTRYLIGGHYSEALTVFEQARDAARLAGDVAGEAHALFGLGTVYGRLGRHPAATDFLRLALQRFRDADDILGQARTLGNLGAVARRRADFRQAVRYQGDARALFELAGDHLGEARALNNLGEIQAYLGRHDLAAEHHHQALALHRQAGDQTGEAAALTNLGTVETLRGRHEEAAAHHRCALALYQLLGHQSGQAWAHDGIGTACTGLGRFDDAANHHRQALELFERIGERDGMAWALNGLGDVARLTGYHHQAIAHHLSALGVAVEIEAADQQGRAHHGLARAHHAGGDTGKARHHWRKALSLYAESGAPEAERISAELAASAALQGSGSPSTA